MKKNIKINNWVEFKESLNYKEDELLQEKWYHNLLVGLMMINPTLGSIAQSLDNDNIVRTEVLNVSQEDALNDIHNMIEHVKNNKKEFENSEKIISQLEKIIKKYESGVITIDSMNKIAKEFIETSKDSPNPSVTISEIDNERGDKRFQNEKTIKDDMGFSKIQETSTLEVTVESEPTTIFVNIFEEGTFESGTYNVDSTLATTINDTLSFYRSKGYTTKIVNIESSTDGQGLSNNLKRDLEDKGYSGDNKGLSQLRNDALKNYLIENVEVDSNQITQNPLFVDDGVIDQSLRYNKIEIKVEKKESTPGETEESIVCVYYKIYSGDDVKIEKDRKSNYKPKKNKKIKGTTDKHGCPTFKVKR